MCFIGSLSLLALASSCQIGTPTSHSLGARNRADDYMRIIHENHDCDPFHHPYDNGGALGDFNHHSSGAKTERAIPTHLTILSGI